MHIHINMKKYRFCLGVNEFQKLSKFYVKKVRFWANFMRALPKYGNTLTRTRNTSINLSEIDPTIPEIPHTQSDRFDMLYAAYQKHL